MGVVLYAVVLAALVPALLGAVPGEVRAQPHVRMTMPVYPHYALDVRLDSAAHTLTGTLEVTVPANDPRAGLEAWWFHLPPNRFLHEDPRGTRREIESIPFARNLTPPDMTDPQYPAGFDPGRIVVLGVVDGSGRRLGYTLADNPRIPQGFSVRDGLMRVQRADPAQRRLVIRFRTELPQRYWEGWSEQQMLVEYWHPVLANYAPAAGPATPPLTSRAEAPAVAPALGWVGDPFAPRGGYYDLSLVVDRRWRVIAGRGHTADLPPGGRFGLAPAPYAARSLPLLLVPEAIMVGTDEYRLSLYTHYTADSERVGLLAQHVARSFIDYVYDRFHLPPPATRITLVEVDGPPGDMRVVGNTVLIPAAYYRNNPILDRLFLAKLSRALARIWFGETVWADEDTQAWLSLGLSGYLALDYFHARYGWDAGLHDVVDWLKPRYREHFFEAPVRQLMRDGRDAPVMVSLTKYPDRRAALLVLYNKSPLVLRSLSYVMGEDAFFHLLNRVYHRYRFRTIDLSAFAAEAEAVHGARLDWYFDAWFRGTPRLDFRIVRWDYTRVDGGYRVWARLAREPAMPAPVEVVFQGHEGEEVSLRWETDQPTDTVEVFMATEPRSVAIDPREHWLELNRQNNYSERHVRIRPLFDWSKQREVLMTVRGDLGGNAVDGNYIGIGLRASLDEDNEVLMIPIYGERTGLVNYELTWNRGHLFHPKLSGHLSLQRLGGTRLRALGMDAQWLALDDAMLHSAIELRYEEVEAAAYDRAGTTVEQPFSPAHNVVLQQDVALQFARIWATQLELEAVHSQRSYGSVYDFTTYQGTWTNRVALGNDHSGALTLVRGMSTGEPPFQKRFFLGGPELLRGYPRAGALSHDAMAVGRLDFDWVFSRTVMGSALQSRRFTAAVFADAGRGWDRDETYRRSTVRHSVGVGLRVDVNLLSVVQFPLRLDVAKPVGDDEYDRPQFILFGVLAF